MEVSDYDSLKNRLLLPFDHSSSLALTYYYEPVVFRPITTKIVMFCYSFLYHPYTIFTLLWMQVVWNPNTYELFHRVLQLPKISHNLLFHFLIFKCNEQWSWLAFNPTTKSVHLSMSAASTFMSNTPSHKSLTNTASFEFLSAIFSVFLSGVL